MWLDDPVLGRPRLILVTGAAAIAVLIAACGGDDDGSSGAEAADTVVLDDFTIEFEPAVLRVGSEVELVNEGLTQHDVAIEGTDEASEILVAGQAGIWVVPEVEPGGYTLYCTIPGHREQGMVASVEIVS